VSNLLLDKPLPSSNDSEVQLLGTIILDTKYIEEAMKTLDSSDMYNPFHREVMASMVYLAQDNKTISPITINEHWKTKGRDQVGNVKLITDLTFGLPFIGPKEFKQLCKIVKEHSVARQMIRTFSAATEDLLYGQEPVKDILERAEAKVLGLSTDLHVEDHKIEKPFSDLIEIVPNIHKQLLDYHAGITNGVATGMKKIDEMLDGGGMQGGALYIVAAGEKAGKTSLALDWGYDIAAVQKAGRVLIVTGEMSKVTMAKRIYSSHAGIAYYRFRPGIYDMPDDPVYSKAIEGLDRFGKIPIAISDKLYNMGQIARHCRREVEHGLKSNDPKKKVVLIILDYLQLIGWDDGKVQRTEEVEKVTRAYKLLLTELDVPGIGISSINRIGLTDGQVPDTFNLKQAGSIANDAEAIFFIHNPAYIPGKPYVPMDMTPMNLILSRQRNGPTGTIPLMFVGPYMQFMTMDAYDRRFGLRDKAKDGQMPKSAGQENMEQEDLQRRWDTA
jgi:replicative DNA helicase